MTILEMVNQIYAKWSSAVSEKVGDNYGMKNSGTISKMPYASCVFRGIPGIAWDLEGDESAIEPTIQIDIFTTGQRALTQAYEIDGVSHNALTSMGFRRYSGPAPQDNIDPSITRYVSEYRRVVGYGDKLPK